MAPLESCVSGPTPVKVDTDLLSLTFPFGRRFNDRLAVLAEGSDTPTERTKVGCAMPNEDAISRDEERRQALRLEAMLDMFEEDRGRSAASIEELRDWMGAQYVDRLQLRMGWRLNIIARAHRLVPGEEHSHLALFRLARGRSDWDRYQA
jgi:hypothetical protein